MEDENEITINSISRELFTTGVRFAEVTPADIVVAIDDLDSGARGSLTPARVVDVQRRAVAMTPTLFGLVTAALLQRERASRKGD